MAFFLGLIIAQLTVKYNHKANHFLLQFSFIGMAFFGINLYFAAVAGKDGIVFTVFSIFSTLLLGYFLGKIFKTENKTSFLINNGTAICGGSAIAAITPFIL